MSERLPDKKKEIRKVCSSIAFLRSEQETFLMLKIIQVQICFTCLDEFESSASFVLFTQFMSDLRAQRNSYLWKCNARLSLR